MRKLCMLVPMLLQACVASGPERIRPLRPLELATAPFQPGATAMHVGSLMYERGCLLFRDRATDELLLPVWPTGSVFNGTSIIFHEPARAEQPIIIAQQFVMQGRGVAWSALPEAPYAPFQRQCAAAPFLVSGVRPAD